MGVVSTIRQRVWRNLFCICAAATFLLSSEASAQSTDTFRGATPFPGTVRDLLREDLAKTSGQLYGAIGTMERSGVLHMRPNTIVALSETNIIASGLRIPGTSQYGVVGDTSYRGLYQLLPADVYAASAVFAIRWEKLGLFASAAAVYTRVADGTEASVGRTLFPVIGMMATPFAHLGVMAAPFLTGPTKLLGDQGTADMFSYLYGGFYDAGPVLLYAGLTGTGRGGGLYTNISQNRLKLLAESVLSEEFSELSYLKAGIDRFPSIKKLFTGELPKKDSSKKEVEEPPDKESLTSFYGRKVILHIPRRGADAVPLEPGKMGFWSIHAEQANIAQLFDVALAAGVAPTPVLHEARIGLHTPEFHSKEESGIGISLGAVQLPATYMLAQQPGLRMALRIEGRYKQIVRMALYRNEPDTLSSFPYAYDAWTYYFSVNPIAFLNK